MNPKEKWIAFKTVVMKDMRRVFRAWVQTLLPPIITSALYFAIFGHVIGSRIGSFEGFPYIQFIAPGLIMMSLLTNSYSSTVTAVYMAKFQRSIEEMIVSPISGTLILLGYLASGVLRGVITGILVAIVALLFTHIHIYSFLTIFFVAILSSSIFSLGGIINAIFAKKFDDVAIVPTFILTPLTYLGGVFYSLKLLPPVWQYISLINPIFYLVETFRYGFLGVFEDHLWIAFVIIVGFNLVLFFWALYLIRKGVGLQE